MTKRDFMTMVMNGEMTDEMKDFARAKIEKLDATLEKRKNTISKKALENIPLMDRIYNEILCEEAKTATDVAEVMEISVQKASSLLRKMVEDGRATKTEVKIPKKGVQKGYMKNFVTE